MKIGWSFCSFIPNIPIWCRISFIVYAFNSLSCCDSRGKQLKMLKDEENVTLNHPPCQSIWSICHIRWPFQAVFFQQNSQFRDLVKVFPQIVDSIASQQAASVRMFCWSHPLQQKSNGICCVPYLHFTHFALLHSTCWFDAAKRRFCIEAMVGREPFGALQDNTWGDPNSDLC